MFAGGCEELDWTLSVLFDAMGAMSSAFNATPERASRAYDKNRDGFVISGGAGVLVLEEYERAKARRARIYGEIVGYGATSDGDDMVAPSGEGAVRCMRQALSTVKAPIDYINPHATSTPVGDLKEIEALREVFGSGEKCPPISATKSLTGHSQGATGVHEAIYSLLMMQQRLHLRKRAYRRDSIRRSPTCRSCASGATTLICAPSFPILSDSAAPTRRSFSSTSTLEVLPPRDPHDHPVDERQARPDHGRRQRSLDRLGRRPGLGRRRRRTRLHLSGRSARETGDAARREPRLPHRPALRRRGPRLRRRGFRRRSRNHGAASILSCTRSAFPTATS